MTDLGAAATVFDNMDMSREDLECQVHEDVEDDSSTLLVNDLSLSNKGPMDLDYVH
jgi:hypothetical protein